MTIILRTIQEEDLERYQYWKLPIHHYHTYNGPYFPKATKAEIEQDIQQLRNAFKTGETNPLPHRMMISNSQKELLGEVSYYWKSIETHWLEVGIVIFDEKNWGKGIGYQALEYWISELFIQKKELVRIGLSTWSGNTGMIHLAEKLGMQIEAVYRKARIVEGIYFDSVSYGSLREEWQKKHN